MVKQLNIDQHTSTANQVWPSIILNIVKRLDNQYSDTTEPHPMYRGQLGVGVLLQCKLAYIGAATIAMLQPPLQKGVASVLFSYL